MVDTLINRAGKILSNLSENKFTKASSEFNALHTSQDWDKVKKEYDDIQKLLRDMHFKIEKYYDLQRITLEAFVKIQRKRDEEVTPKEKAELQEKTLDIAENLAGINTNFRLIRDKANFAQVYLNAEGKK